MSINLNYVAWENRLIKSKPEVKKIGCVSSQFPFFVFFYLKNLKFTCFEIFLSLFRL